MTLDEEEEAYWARQRSQGRRWLARGGIGGGGDTPNFGIVDSSFNLTTQTTYTYTGLNFGPANTKRVLACGFAGRETAGGVTISSVTIGGVSATLAPSSNTEDATNLLIGAFYYAAVPTGASGNVVVVFGASCDRCGLGLWRIITNTAAPSSGNVATYTQPLTTPSLTVTVPALGFAPVIFFERSQGTVTWTNATADFDFSPAGVAEFSGAHATATGSVVMTPGATDGAALMSSASWGP